VLTALAIVLGVAMICGSFVLTDSMSNAFGRSTPDLQEHGCRHQRQSAISSSTQDAPPFSETRCPRVKRCRRQRGDRRRRRVGAPDRQERQGDLLRRRANIGFRWTRTRRS
jgi:hypothetical protein